ncbi:MAG: hypothetical protein ABI199_07630 [Bacteroidia bacterium]
MKKSIKIILAASFALLCLSNVKAAKSFEGVITYDIKIDNSAGTIPQEQMAMFEGSTLTLYTKEDFTKVQMSMGPIQSTTITDKKSNVITTLFNTMGQKMMTKMKLDSLMKAGKGNVNEPTYKYDSETKTIAGYLCKKAEMTVVDKKTGEKITSVVYYTEDIPALDHNVEGVGGYPNGLKGYPLEYEIHRKGITMKMTAKSVEKKTLTNADFAIPDGYTLMSLDQMKMMQQGGGH